jgi:predicted RNA-binding protein with PUA-like domain
MLKKTGKAGQEWDGVRNYAARNHMRAMKIGDRGFFYHSNEGLDVVGLVEVCKLAHPDSTTDDARWECVDIRALRDVPHPPTLDEIKANPKLEDMVLVNNSRLSVQPVSDAEWKEVCRMGGVEAA